MNPDIKIILDSDEEYRHNDEQLRHCARGATYEAKHQASYRAE
jgi:hypothetical protein